MPSFLCEPPWSSVERNPLQEPPISCSSSGSGPHCREFGDWPPPMENSQHISLVIQYRGRIEMGVDRLLSYVDGELSMIDWVNVDWLSEFLIKDILKKIGYPKVCEIQWLQPGMGLDDGLRVLKYDRDVVSMYEAARVNGNEVQLFIEHPVSVPEFVTKGEGAAGGSNPGENITPKRGRTKVCARKTPTSKKSYGPKKALLRGEGTHKEGNACAPSVNNPAIEGSIDEETDHVHEHPGVDFMPTPRAAGVDARRWPLPHFKPPASTNIYHGGSSGSSNSTPNK